MLPTTILVCIAVIIHSGPVDKFIIMTRIIVTAVFTTSSPRIAKFSIFCTSISNYTAQA